MTTLEIALLIVILIMSVLQTAAMLVRAWRRQPDMLVTLGLKDDLDALGQGFDDLTERLRGVREGIAALRTEIDAVAARQSAADDRCATCLLRSRPDAVAPGE